MIAIAKPKFNLGKLVATPGALEALAVAGQTPMDFVGRHVRGDWGDRCEEDWQANEDALRYGARLLSVYRTAKGTEARCWPPWAWGVNYGGATTLTSKC